MQFVGLSGIAILPRENGPQGQHGFRMAAESTMGNEVQFMINLEGTSENPLCWRTMAE